MSDEGLSLSEVSSLDQNAAEVGDLLEGEAAGGGGGVVGDEEGSGHVWEVNQVNGVKRERENGDETGKSPVPSWRELNKGKVKGECVDCCVAGDSSLQEILAPHPSPP